MAQVKAPPDMPAVFVLDEARLAATEPAEKQELYLLQWLAQVERDIKTATPDVLKTVQPTLEKTLLRLISLSTAKPRRPIRFLIGRCSVLLYTRGDTRQLFDTITALHSLINATKNIDIETKIAAISTAGTIMEAVGGKVLSLYADTANGLLKVVKNRNHSLLLRLEAINAFTQLLKGAGKAATDASIKDWMKQLKAGLTDKALALRVACAQCIEASLQHTTQTFTAHDIDALLQMCMKAFENATFAVRRAVSSLSATLLALTQTKALVDANKPNVKYVMSGDAPAPTTAPGEATHDTPLLSLKDMLHLLAASYHRPTTTTTTREVKIGIIETYATLFTLLGTDVIESNYAIIVSHVFKELLQPSSKDPALASPSEMTFARAQAFFLLHHTIGKRLLSEQGQAEAIRVLVAQWLKAWPPLKTAPPNKQALLCATNVVAALICELEGAAVSVQAILIDPLFVLLTHPSFSVQMAAVWAIRCLCSAVPSNLPYLLPRALNALEKDLGSLSNPSASVSLFRRTLAYAYASAAIMSVFPSRPIYTSFELSARAMSLASHLLKQSQQQLLQTDKKEQQQQQQQQQQPMVVALQLQIAWILVGGLMALGPNLVKLHLPQLLLFWKSALPKPTGKEANSIKAETEWSFLFHTRACAINAIYSFLAHNSHSLVTLDIAKRIAALLNNTVAFLATAPTNFSPATQSPCVPYAAKLTDQYYMLRKRLCQCFVVLRPLLSTHEASLTSLLRQALTVFTEPDKLTPSSGAHVQITATVPGQFVSLWTATDGHGHGVTSKLQGYHVDAPPFASQNNVSQTNGTQFTHASFAGGAGAANGAGTGHANPATTSGSALNDDEDDDGHPWQAKDHFEPIEALLERPILGSVHLDPLLLFSTFDKTRYLKQPEPVAPSSGYVDAALDLFTTLFPHQPPPVQEAAFDHMAKMLKDCRAEKNSPKRAALLVNVVVALLNAFRSGALRLHAETRAVALVQDILMEAVSHPDPYLRNAASETLGRLTAMLGGQFVAAQMQQLVDLVVSNRDPDVRAGAALTIGYIYSHVGGMAAASHLKTLVGILLSLSSDPHPVVHVWALEALAMTIRAAGLLFSGYVNSTLSMVAKLYLCESHEPGAGSVAVSNAGMTGSANAYMCFGRIIYELIGTLGPELQASSKIRELCLTMVEELKLEPDNRVNVQAIRCLQHFLMFAPQNVDVRDLVPYLQRQLTSVHLPLKKAAITCLYQLVQRDPSMIFKMVQQGIDSDLFTMLDTDPRLYDVKNVIKTWLKETCVQEPSVWVSIAKRILTQQPTAKPTGVDASMAANASESAGTKDDGAGLTRSSVGDNDFDDFDAANDDDDDDDDTMMDLPTSVADASGMVANRVRLDLPPRWRTQLFALQCLQKTIEWIALHGEPAHFDLILARKRRQQAGLGDYLVFRLPDLIRLSFTAATAQVNELRLAGIGLLKMIIEKFAATEDADMEDMLLLEQYAAQIGAALTPAFGADSSSEIVAAAVRVCAIYVGSGIVKDLYQLSRVLKLLTSALDRCKDESKLSGVGEVKDLSPHASVMVKLSVLNAWAELQVASQRQDYIRQILKPNLAILSPLWLRSLKDYARIRLESDIIALSSGAEGVHASQTSGIDAMYSVATKEVVLPYYRRSWLKIMEAVASLIEQQSPSMLDALSKEQQTDAPHGLFSILFGLCMESLSRVAGASGRADASAVMLICLSALKTYVQPSLTGDQFLDKGIFLELVNVLDRLIQTEGHQVKRIIVTLLQQLMTNYGAEIVNDDLDPSDQSNDLVSVDQDLASDVFPSTSKLYYILRLLVAVFLQYVPSLGSKSVLPRKEMNKKHIQSLLQQSLEALAQLTRLTPPKFKVDLLAVCLHIYFDLLMGDASYRSLAPTILVCFKTMLHNFEEPLLRSQIKALAALIATVSRKLMTDVFSDLSTPEAVNLAKNRLLAIVLIVTGCPQAFLSHADNMKLLLDVVAAGLDVSNDEIRAVVHQCVRTLMSLAEMAPSSVNSGASQRLGRQFSRNVMPLLLERILALRDSANPRPDDIHTLVAMPAHYSDAQQIQLLELILPTLTTLLDEPPYNDATPLSPLHTMVLPSIMTLATSVPQVFRESVQRLPQATRGHLEASVRFNIESQQRAQQQQQQQLQLAQEKREQDKQPTIQLKMDFSNFS